MARPEKVQAVADIKERLESANAVFLAEYAGLSVAEQQALRRGLRSSDAEFKVVKMSLARRAAADLGLDELDELLIGPTALAFADGDPVPAAKALKDFSGDHAALLIKGGLIGRDFLPPEKVSQLADIEPREVLLAKMAGALQAPMARTASLLAALLRNSASVFKQLLDQKEAAQPAAEAAQPAAAAETDSATEPGAAAEADSAAEPEEADSPDSPDSPDSLDSPDSPDSPASPDSPDSPESPASPDEPADAGDGTDDEPADAGDGTDDEPADAGDETDDEPADAGDETPADAGDEKE